MSLQDLTNACVEIAIEAGNAIEALAAEFEVHQKKDESPVTSADLASEQVILKGLSSLSEKYPVLSEESHQDFELPAGRFWCVDPLDGTKDFIAKTGDYTVNIALMEDGQPIIGVVQAPHRGLTYFANPHGCWRRQGTEINPIKVRALNPHKFTALISRFHSNPKLVQALESMPEVELLNRGSAIKLCAIAEGSADVYPRLTPCFNWDIAAAHCVLRAAGGEIFNFNLGDFTYNDVHPWLLGPFIAVNDLNYNWQPFLEKLPKTR